MNTIAQNRLQQLKEELEISGFYNYSNISKFLEKYEHFCNSYLPEKFSELAISDLPRIRRLIDDSKCFSFRSKKRWKLLNEARKALKDNLSLSKFKLTENQILI